jgi:hypothetical protein
MSALHQVSLGWGVISSFLTFFTAVMHMCLSSLRAGDACCNAAPLFCTAANTISVSAFNPLFVKGVSANCSARPLLFTAARTTSRSLLSSFEALSSARPSHRTAVSAPEREVMARFRGSSELQPSRHASINKVTQRQGKQMTRNQPNFPKKSHHGMSSAQQHRSKQW